MGIKYVLWFIFASILVIILAYYVSRYYASFSLSVNKSRYIKILDKYMIGKDKYIILICINEKYYLIGITNNNINLISVIDDLKEYSTSQNMTDDPQSSKVMESFKEILMKNIHRKQGNK
jgi:flagellar protein FliO/FliZ